jgi:hypothetical protein
MRKLLLWTIPAAILLSGQSEAFECRTNSDTALAELVAVGDAHAAATLRGMRSFIVADIEGDEICRIRTISDLDALRGSYAVKLLADSRSLKAEDNVTYDGKSGYYQLGSTLPALYIAGLKDEIANTLAANQKTLDAVWQPTLHAHFRASLKKYDFAGVRVGDSLQSVFTTMRKQNYKEETDGHQRFAGYRYDFSCETETVTLRDWPFTNTQSSLKLCRAHGYAFEKLDADGTYYRVEVWTTPFDRGDRQYALAHAQVYLLDATVRLKHNVGKAYYDHLADQRYGKERHGGFDASSPPLKYFTDVIDNFADRTRFDITPKEDDLKISVEDRDLLNERYAQTVEALLAARRSETANAPTPHF